MASNLSSSAVAGGLTVDDRDPTPSPASPKSPWTEEDEVSLLEAVLEIVMEPLESFDPTVSPFGRIRRAVKGSFTDREVLDRIWELRRCCCCCCKGGTGGGVIGSSSGTVVELSNRIWGSGGVQQQSGKNNGVVMRCYARKRKRESAQKEESIAA